MCAPSGTCAAGRWNQGPYTRASLWPSSSRWAWPAPGRAAPPVLSGVKRKLVTASWRFQPSSESGRAVSLTSGAPRAGTSRRRWPPPSWVSSRVPVLPEACSWVVPGLWWVVALPPQPVAAPPARSRRRATSAAVRVGRRGGRVVRAGGRQASHRMRSCAGTVTSGLRWRFGPAGHRPRGPAPAPPRSDSGPAGRRRWARRVAGSGRRGEERGVGAGVGGRYGAGAG